MLHAAERQRAPDDLAVSAGGAGRSRALAGALVAAAAIAVILPIAWVSDDAMITLHQVRVFVEGHGIVWNPGWRVQAFTHPAWFLLLSAGHALTGSLWWLATLLPLALSVAALLLLWRFADSPARLGTPVRAALFAAVPLLSQGFRDFATSGLETPLSLLLAAAVLSLTLDDRPLRFGTRVALWLLLATAVLTRPDHALLFGPLALAVLAEGRGRDHLAVLPGLVLLLAWFGFATFYFGSPLPNTFFAKLGSGLGTEQKLASGLLYMADAFTRERVALGLVLLGTLCGLWGRGRSRVVALGLLATLAYILWIGGDFMRGRFLVVPMFVALFLIAEAAGRVRPAAGLAALGLVLLTPTLATRAIVGPIEGTFNAGIEDERLFYVHRYSMFGENRALPEPGGGDFSVARPEHVVFACAVGALRFSQPATTHVVDFCALAEPVLARVEAGPLRLWRIGHHVRGIPDNYDHVLLGTEDRLSVPELQPLYDDMRLIATAPLWSAERLAALRRRALGTGRHGPAVHPRLVGPEEPVPDRWLARRRDPHPAMRLGGSE